MKGGSNMHKETFSHEGSISYEDTFVRRVTFAREYKINKIRKNIYI